LAAEAGAAIPAAASVEAVAAASEPGSDSALRNWSTRHRRAPAFEAVIQA
jgi:hypothetical protein